MKSYQNPRPGREPEGGYPRATDHPGLAGSGLGVPAGPLARRVPHPGGSRRPYTSAASYFRAHRE